MAFVVSTVATLGILFFSLGELIYFLIGVVALLRGDLEKAGKNVLSYSKFLLYNLIITSVAGFLQPVDAKVNVYGLEVSFTLMSVLLFIPRLLPYYFLWTGYRKAKEENWNEAGGMFKIFAPPYFLAMLSNILLSTYVGLIP